MTIYSLETFARALRVKVRRMAEVGVYRGDNAAAMLRQFPGAELYLVDPWRPNNLKRTYEIDNSPEKWERVYQECRAQFRGDKRVTILRKGSDDALPWFKPGSLDLVFLDAGRERSRLVKLIRDWRPKLSARGILAGKGLRGNMAPDVLAALNAELPGWRKVKGTTWGWYAGQV